MPTEFDKVAILLIEKGADVNIVGNDDKTALIEAAIKGIKGIFNGFVFSKKKCSPLQVPRV